MSTSSRTEVRVASARMFELLLDWFPDIIQSVNSAGHIVYANRKASELLGYPRDEILGMHVSQIYAPEIWEKVQHGFAQLKDKGSLTVLESLLQDKAGNKIPVEIRSFAVYDENKEFVRTFSILRDTREIKELQNSLIHTSRLAAIGELAACVAHDITNPLSVIKLYNELLLSEVADLKKTGTTTANLEDALGSVRKSAEKIERIVNHLRDFSRSREGQAEVVDLRNVIIDGLFMITNKTDKGNIAVIRDFPAEAAIIRGNANQLEQVFMNLFSNACDAMKGRPKPELTIQLRPVARGGIPGWACQVRDNGSGIPPDIQEQVFAPFFTTKPKGEGTGLGLSIAQNIVRRHNGEISVESTPGQGTAFTVFLPAGEKPPDPATAA